MFSKLNKVFLPGIMCCMLQVTGYAQLSVTPGQTAQALAQKLAGPGITVQNATLTCPSNANGTFKTVTSNLGLDSGIVLTTGRAATTGSSFGVNGSESSLASTNNGAAGDPQLNTLANSTTHDACILEFDLIPKGDTISFDYVFGSEEYNNSTCGNYNDAFAFFISGAGITGQQNIALVPGTTIPVAVNSINNGIPGSQGNIANCTSMGAGSPFTAYYTNNSGGTSLTYKGITHVLRAVHNVTACSTYHLKLTVADAGNGLYDSGVFIKAGSLKTNTWSVDARGNTTTGTSTPFIVKGCSAGSFTVKRSQTRPLPQTVKLQIAGTAVNGTDYTTIADSVVIPANDTQAVINITPLITAANGVKQVKIYAISPYSCNGVEIVDSATLLIYDAVPVHIDNNDTTVCAGAIVSLHISGNTVPFTYSWSPAAGLNSTIISSPAATPVQTTTYAVTATWPGSGCSPVTDSVTIHVTPQPSVQIMKDTSLCANASLPLNITVHPAGNYLYEWTGPDNYMAGTEDPVLQNVQPFMSGYYSVKVGAAGCIAVSDSVKISIHPYPDAPEVISPVSICIHAIHTALSAGGGNLLWYTDATGGTGNHVAPTPQATAPGSTNYYVSQTAEGCESVRSEITVIAEKCCEDNLFIPSAFSPNGDGINDVFRIKKGPEDKLVQFNIYNRWGQIIFTGHSEDAWDGTYGGQPVESGVYFYQLEIGCEKGSLISRTGDITLVR
ncbi:choice-of-anchor L domain-containing protein [Chitinophagaceae bacterium MMS25-I14]